MPVLITRADYERMILIFRWVEQNVPTTHPVLAETSRSLATLLETQLKQQ